MERSTLSKIVYKTEVVRGPITDARWEMQNPNFKIDNQNKFNFISVTNKVSQTSFKLERIKENIFYELKTLFMETEGRCVYLENPDQDEEENFAILKFLKSQGLMNP